MFDRIKKMFSNLSTEEKKNPNLKTEQEFLQSDLLKNFIEEHKRPTLLLQPTLAKKPISHLMSKMGGEPNLTNVEEYPTCQYCKQQLSFVFQLYKRDFPDFYFPKDKNLFQLFRCRDYDCQGIADTEYMLWDHPMFHYYYNCNESLPNKKFEVMRLKNEDFEDLVPDCQLQPLETIDLPSYEDADSHIYDVAEKEFAEGCEDLLFEKYSAKYATKIGGYPSWTQGTNVPDCNCGKTKEFFFQLCSEEPNDSGANDKDEYRYSAHNIMIGDSGGIYYFICPTCGEDSIESNWDCC